MIPAPLRQAAPELVLNVIGSVAPVVPMVLMGAQLAIATWGKTSTGGLKGQQALLRKGWHPFRIAQLEWALREDGYRAPEVGALIFQIGLTETSTHQRTDSELADLEKVKEASVYAVLPGRFQAQHVGHLLQMFGLLGREYQNWGPQALAKLMTPEIIDGVKQILLQSAWRNEDVPHLLASLIRVPTRNYMKGKQP
jgi:hypothetical protein